MFYHRPLFDIDKIIAHYEEKDGVPIKYVCTSALGDEAFAGDIFYRDTPHPEYGNRYFRIFMRDGKEYIQSADTIERESFTMISGMLGWEYSQHRHDYHSVAGTSISIDGGRSYFRAIGGLKRSDSKVFVVLDGKFEEVV